MRKLKLEIDALEVETFEPVAERGERGTVRGHLTAYYELCYEGDTWQNTCTCEPTCNAQTCYNCPQPTGGTCNTACGAYTCQGYASCDPAILCTGRPC